MKFDKKTSEIRNSILSNMKNLLSKVEGSYNFDIASAEAEEIKGIYDEAQNLRKQMFPWTVNEEPYLSMWLETFGLKRLGETKATGEVTIEGVIGTIVPSETILISRTGQKFKTLDNCLIGAEGKGKVNIEALNGGEVGNTAIGDIISFEAMNQNIYSVYNEKAIVGGAPIESIESCHERMKEKASEPNHSGNKNEYKIWCKEVAGVGNVKVIGAGEHSVPKGHVDIYISTIDGKIPSSELIQKVQNHLSNEDRIPICALVTVKAFNPLMLNITFNSVTVKKGVITKENWIKEFKRLLELGLATQNFLIGDIVPYPKISAIALGVTGTVIYDDLKLNSNSHNLSIQYNQLPVPGTIEITSFLEVD